MPRIIYLVAYDVCNAARLNRVRKALEGFRVSGQKSFFECWMTQEELRIMMLTLRELIDVEVDRIHVFQIDPRQQVHCLGTAIRFDEQAFMIL